MCILLIHLVGVGACNKANADAVKTCLIFIPVYNVGQEKLEALKEIADEVNPKKCQD